REMKNSSCSLRSPPPGRFSLRGPSCFRGARAPLSGFLYSLFLCKVTTTSWVRFSVALQIHALFQHRPNPNHPVLRLSLQRVLFGHQRLPRTSSRWWGTAEVRGFFHSPLRIVPLFPLSHQLDCAFSVFGIPTMAHIRTGLKSRNPRTGFFREPTMLQS